MVNGHMKGVYWFQLINAFQNIKEWTRVKQLIIIYISCFQNILLTQFIQ